MQNVKFTVSTRDANGETLKEFEVTRAFGQDLAESAKVFGDDVVHSHFMRSAIIQIQAYLRNAMTPGKDKPAKVRTQAEAQAAVDQYEVKVREQADPVEKAKAVMAKLSDEDLKALGLKRAK